MAFYETFRTKPEWRCLQSHTANELGKTVDCSKDMERETWKICYQNNDTLDKY